MGGTRVKISLSVVVGSLVVVGYGQSDGGSEGVSKLCARKNRNSVLLIALSGEVEEEEGGEVSLPYVRSKTLLAVLKYYRSSEIALAGTSARELRLDIVLCQGQAWGASVNDASNAFAVRLSKGRDAEVGAEGRHGLVCS